MTKIKNKLCVLLSLMSFSAFSAPKEEPISFSSKWGSVEGRPYFMSHEEWLAVPVQLEPMEELRNELNKRHSFKLNFPKEAHVKVITPSEWRILKQRITMEDVEKMALKSSLYKMPLKPVCISKVVSVLKDQTDSSWVLQVKAPEMLKFRREVWRYYVTKGGAGPDFQWRKWHPCVTVGYTSAEVFDEEMATKEKTACTIALGMTP